MERADAAMIRRIEELSLNAWPALETILLDRWVVRFADGYTRRANSVNPLYDNGGEAEGAERVTFCETLYARTRKLDVVFKITPVAPEYLDPLLEQRRYRREAETSVQTLELETTRLAESGLVELDRELTPEWLAAYCALAGVNRYHLPAMTRMLQRITAPAVTYASIRREGETVAVGLAVIERGHVGLFDITTGAPWRRQGLGKQLVSALLNWGQRQGATTAYLQVMRNNTAALSLYARLGFTESYHYWYRILSAAQVPETIGEDG